MVLWNYMLVIVPAAMYILTSMGKLDLLESRVHVVKVRVGVVAKYHEETRIAHVSRKLAGWQSSNWRLRWRVLTMNITLPITEQTDIKNSIFQLEVLK
jgi:hypothetical protein